MIHRFCAPIGSWVLLRECAKMNGLCSLNGSLSVMIPMPPSRFCRVPSLLQLSRGDGNHAPLSTRASELNSRSTAAGVTFLPLLLNLINYGSEQNPRQRGDSKPVTLSGP